MVFVLVVTVASGQLINCFRHILYCIAFCLMNIFPLLLQHTSCKIVSKKISIFLSMQAMKDVSDNHKELANLSGNLLC